MYRNWFKYIQNKFLGVDNRAIIFIMILFIDTSHNSYLSIKVKKGGQVVKKRDVPAERRQSEELLDQISIILKELNLNLSEIKGIQVVATGEVFTGLRIGVATANTLGYALGIDLVALDNSGRKRDDLVLKKDGFSIVFPEYNKEPSITEKK